jgi:hypothetical protein
MLKSLFLCRMMNVAKLAFWEGRRCASRYSCPGQAAEPDGERFVAPRRVMHPAGGHPKDAQRLRFAAVASLSENTMCAHPSMTPDARAGADPIVQEGDGRPLRSTRRGRPRKRYVVDKW